MIEIIILNFYKVQKILLTSEGEWRGGIGGAA